MVGVGAVMVMGSLRYFSPHSGGQSKHSVINSKIVEPLHLPRAKSEVNSSQKHSATASLPSSLLSASAKPSVLPRLRMILMGSGNRLQFRICLCAVVFLSPVPPQSAMYTLGKMRSPANIHVRRPSETA